MIGSARVFRHRGEATGSYLAIVVGGVMLVAIGFVLGRGLSGGPAEPEFEASVADRISAAVTQEMDRRDEDSRQLAGDIAEIVADRLAAGADSQAEAIAEALRKIILPSDGAAAAPVPPAAEASGAKRPGPPPIEFDPPRLDFGMVPPGQEMRGTVQIRNVGDEPVKILAMKPDCACTTLEDLTGRVIEPGKSVPLTAVVDARASQGSKRSEIRFVFEGFAPVAVKIVSEITRAVRIEPVYIDLQSLDEYRGVCSLRALDGRPFRVLAAQGAPPTFADGFDPDRDEPRHEYLLEWDFTMYDPVSCKDSQGRKMPMWWVVETDHPDAPLLDVRVRHDDCTLPDLPAAGAGRQWIVSPFGVNLNEFREGESKEFTVSLYWRKHRQPNDTIGQVRSESDQFDAELVSVERDGENITCTVRVTPVPGHRGLIYGVARFQGLNNPEDSQVFWVMGRVADEAEDTSGSG